MTAARHDRPEGWPFWAPSDLAKVERALDVAAIAPGERLVDLGCGDGQVLVAAGRRGALVEGVEVDEDLAEVAREALAAAGVDGKVVVGDVFTHPLDADVLFTYLSPATLQRLVPRFRRDAPRGTRLVTVDYAVPGLEPAVDDWPVHLYRLPARTARRRRRAGWPSAGLVTTVVPDSQSLTVLSFHHAGGPVRARRSGALRSAASVQLGADDAARGEMVAVDVRWEPRPAGEVLTGAISVAGVGTLTVAGVVADEEHEVWELTEHGVERLKARLRSRGLPAPTSVAELVAACND